MPYHQMVCLVQYITGFRHTNRYRTADFYFHYILDHKSLLNLTSIAQFICGELEKPVSPIYNFAINDR